MNDKQNAVLSLRLAYIFAKERNLEKEANDIRSMEIEWDRSYTSTLRRGYIIELFQNQKLFNEFVSKCWPQGSSTSGKAYTQHCLRIREQYKDFLAGHDPDIEVQEPIDTPGNDISFELESQLRDFIAGNLASIPVQGKALSLYVDAEGQDGVEYPTGVGRIDILATDKKGSFVVFELKRASSPDHAIGQVARYMGWVRQHLAIQNEVFGVIVAKTINDKLRYAIKVLPNVSLFEYEVKFNLHPADNVLK